MAVSRCVQCGGRWDMPGKFRCELKGHPSPTLAQRISLAIEEDMNDRRGLNLSDLDDDVRDDIVARWNELITKELLK